MKPFILLFALMSAVLTQNYAERQCACTLSTLWLDVVAVVDTSDGMTVNGIQEAAANIIGVFAQSNISQQYGQTTRLGIVSYSDKASTLAPLNYFNSTSDLLNQMFTLIPSKTTGDESYLKTGLSEAQDVLKNGRLGTNRNNVKQVILVYASDYMTGGVNDPTALANQIKESGINIITVAFFKGELVLTHEPLLVTDANIGPGIGPDNNNLLKEESKILQGLQSIATRRMGYSNKDADVTGEIQNALCQANCFCPNTWQQFTDNYTNATMGYGTCLKLGQLDAIWLAARGACNVLNPSGYLATEFDSTKHNFNAAMIRADPTGNMIHSYHIGLSYNSSTHNWQWEQPNLGKLQAGQSYTNWNNGFPDNMYTSQNYGCVINAQQGTSNDVGWQNENCVAVSKRYVCQVTSCDTDNYCQFAIT